MLATCRELGIAFVAFSPLARQFLTGECGDVDSVLDDDIRATIARPRFEPENFAKNRALLTPYAAIAERVGCSMAQLALAWLLHQEGVTATIVGPADVGQLEATLDVPDLALDDATLAHVDMLFPPCGPAPEAYAW